MGEAMQLVEVRPVKPFVGSFKCSLAEADFIDDALEEKDGVVVKVKIPRRRYIGLIAVYRALTVGEIEARIRGELDPETFELDPDGIDALSRVKPGSNQVPAIFATVHPTIKTLKLPADIAASLIQRGLATKVEPAKSKGK